MSQRRAGNADHRYAADHPDFEQLGFIATLKGNEFSILERDGVELHFALKPDHDPARTATWINVREDNADAIYEELKAADVGRSPRAHRFHARHRRNSDRGG